MFRWGATGGRKWIATPSWLDKPFSEQERKDPESLPPGFVADYTQSGAQKPLVSQELVHDPDEFSWALQVQQVP